jgi:hypothetical protein
MEVSYGHSVISEPAEAQHTEITTYMWPGFLGEYDHVSMEFTAWELVEPSLWMPRPDIVAPPMECLGIDTVKGRRWTSSGEHWLVLQEPTLWRRIALRKTQNAPS